MTTEQVITDCTQLRGKRLRAICEGRAHIPLFKINRYRRLWGLPPLREYTPEVEFGAVKFRVGAMPQAGDDIPPRVRKSRGCGCGKSIVRKAIDFATAAAKFIGDGCQTVGPQELALRESACESCPLRSGGICNACGCQLHPSMLNPGKLAMRLESCPAGKWLPDIRPRRPFAGDPRRNLVMHVMPVSGSGVWQWNCEQIAARQNLFTGRRILAIATMPNRRKLRERPRKELATDTAEAVRREFNRLGMHWDEVLEVNNDSKLREVATFIPMLTRVQSTDPDEVTFCCHAKGVTHPLESIVSEWTSALYETCLDDWPSVRNALESYAMAGSMRRFGQFTTAGNNRWHYSGTFYWLRHSDVFTRDWRKIDQMFFGTESWPGRMFTADECACLWADDISDAYQASEWSKRLRKELATWRESRSKEEA